jgi:hypothetical protein
MYNLDPSRGCDFLYDLESGAGKVDCYRITSPDAPLTLLQQIATALPQSGGVMGIAYVQLVVGREDH